MMQKPRRNSAVSSEPQRPCRKQTGMQWSTRGLVATRTVPNAGDARLSRLAYRRLLGLALACTGFAILGFAWQGDTTWFDRHFLPNFFIPRPRQLAVGAMLRLLAVLLGLTLVMLGAAATRWHGEARRLHHMVATAAILAAVFASAVLTAELILRTRTWRAAQFHNRQEPRRIADPYLGWKFEPKHHGYKQVAGRRIDFAIDADGHRVAEPSQQMDFALPSVIFSGESVMAGDGLQWRETIPARVAERLHLQPATIAVNGYSTDQAHMRLAAELPRFACPVAVVSIFMPSFLDRNLNVDRPHLDRDLGWHPARPGWRLAALAQDVLHYRSSAEIEQGIRMTRAVLAASKALALSHGAVPILITPQFTPETLVESAIRKRVLDDGGLDHVTVPVDSRFRIPGDMHPNAHGAALIAAAVSIRLEAAGLTAAITKGNQGGRRCQRSAR